QGYIVISARDVFGCVTHGFRTAKFLEADEVWMFRTQCEEQVGAGCKTVIRAVVDNGWQIGSRRKDRLEMSLLRRDRRPTRENARNNHHALRTNFLRMGCVSGSDLRINSAGADDDGHACL